MEEPTGAESGNDMDTKPKLKYPVADERLVRAQEFYTRLGVCKSKFYKSVREGKLPAPIKVSPRNSVWPAIVVSGVIDDIKNGNLKF